MIHNKGLEDGSILLSFLSTFNILIYFFTSVQIILDNKTYMLHIQKKNKNKKKATLVIDCIEITSFIYYQIVLQQKHQELTFLCKFRFISNMSCNLELGQICYGIYTLERNLNQECSSILAFYNTFRYAAKSQGIFLKQLAPLNWPSFVPHTW